MFRKLWADEEGLTSIEWALLLALVAIVAITLRVILTVPPAQPTPAPAK